MKIKIEIDETTITGILLEYIESKLGNIAIRPEQLHIMVKSKQNYKSEWEKADFKAEYEVNE